MLIILAAAAAICSPVSIHDGDTIRCGAERVRIANIDAPELPGSPKCQRARRGRAWCDFAAGAAAREALRGLAAGRRVIIDRTRIAPYGRTLALVRIGGVDAGEFLITQGLARPWR